MPIDSAISTTHFAMSSQPFSELATGIEKIFLPARLGDRERGTLRHELGNRGCFGDRGLRARRASSGDTPPSGAAGPSVAAGASVASGAAGASVASGVSGACVPSSAGASVATAPVVVSLSLVVVAACCNEQGHHCEGARYRESPPAGSLALIGEPS